ncbi:MAG: hypothetical protein JO092_06665 [Candidatus Eremiobacteraeota bacterium]|nr:hypothetical protein [Candidatus Eremiobacteraeota bacterium]
MSERPNASYKQLFHFNGKDGQGPGTLTHFNGLLYGTTVLGGPLNSGVIFTITPAGNEHELNAFKDAFDGSGPNSPLIVVGGELYGTANSAGKNNAGVVFKMTTSGKISVVYNFKGFPDGAARPAAAASLLTEPSSGSRPPAVKPYCTHLPAATTAALHFPR